MAGQSITFDFISRGAGKLKDDFKQTGDTAAAAAKGAKVLQETIGRLGQKENRTSEESLRLAKALRLTGDAGDRAAAKALGAEIAIRKLAEEEELAAAKARKLAEEEERAAAKARKLAEAQANAARKTAAARGGFAGLAGEITGFGAAAGVADSKGSLFSKALAGLNLASGVLEPALAGVVVAAGGLAAGFAAAASGIGVFGVVAKTVLAQASKAATATSAAQDTHAAAIAKVTGQYRIAMSTAKTQAQKTAAFAAEQKGFQTAALNQQVAVNKATAGLSPPVQALAGKLTDLKARWKAFTDAAAPGVTGVLSQGIGILASHFGLLKPFLAPTEKALSGILAKLNTGLNSAGFTSFLGAFAKNSGPAITKIAAAIGNVVVGIGGILKAFLPTSQTMLSGIDKITAKFREWGTTLSGHSGFQSLMTTFRTETPQAVAILRNLGVVLVNVGKAMFGLSTFSNSKVLLQALLPLSGVLAALSKNTGLVRLALYLYAATTAAGKLKPAMTALFGVDGEGGIIRGAVKAVGWIGKMTKAMLGLDVAMNANVVGLIVIAIAALGIAFAVAWKKSAAFRDVIKDIAKVFLAAGIIFVRIEKVIVDSFLSMIGTILHGLATAFGWIPGGVGRSLKAASRSFDNFKAGTDNVINGIIGKMQDWQNSLDASKRTVAVATTSIVRNFQGQGAAALRGRDDVNTYTDAVRNNGAKSDAARSARTRLIGDLERAGKNARDANRMVDNLQGAINRMHGRTVSVIVQGGGKGKITIDSYGVGKVGTTGLKFMARGGAVTGGTPGRDSVLGMLMPGEVVVPAGMVRRGAVDHLRGRLPGFASGGLVGAIDAAPGVAASAEAGFAAKVETAFAQRALAALRAAAGSGSGIVAYARSFLGQIPYVMGGNSLSGGIDCSGFVQQVYGHFGIHAPRTSETQFGWARRTGPVPGGMAFYVSPAGGPPPGHVAIVQDASSVISQGGGMGPKIERLRFLPLMGTGVPPGGLPAAMGKGGNPAVSGSLQAIALSLLRQYGWGNQWGAFNSLENAEAGWNMTARNPSSGAYGLAQFINGPGEYAQYGGDATTGLGQLTAMMNYIGQRWHDPDGAWANEAAHHWYAKGGLVQKFDQGGVLRPGVTMAVNNTGRDEQVIPGYASGGLVSARAAAYLRAWEAHHGGGTINDQAARAGRALAHDSTLARASLPPGLHHHYVTLAAADRHRRDALLRERGIMRDWRNQLGASDHALASWIAAAGHSRLLAPDVRRWERQRAGQEREIGRVSVMLGPTPAMRAAAAKASAAHPPRPSSAQTAKEGATYLRAWQARRGGGPGAAWGPVPVNPQIDQMNAAAKQAATLAGARGLTAAQRKHYVQLAGADRARVAVLIHERDTERAWRNILGADDQSLASWIAAAAGTPSMTKNAAGWKAQLARQKATIAGISGMLGWSAAQVKAGSGGPPLPKITHVYGGDVTGTIGAFLSSVAAPFTGKLMDRGGWLKPGWSSVYNATGRPEHLVPARSGGTIQLEIVSSGQSEFDQFMVTWMRRHVKVRGGGNVQAAFGTH